MFLRAVLVHEMIGSYCVVKQRDETDCGAACLATVARTHGLKIPVTTIREYAGTDRRGTNVLGIVEAAQQLGFVAKGVKGDPKALSQIPLPCIAHVVMKDTLHYVVVHKVTQHHVVVADPAQGIVKQKRNDFLAIWTGVLILLTPSATFSRCVDSPGVWRRFGRLLEPYDFLIAETLLATLFLMLLGLGTSLYIQLLVDKVLINKSWLLLRWLSLGLLGVVVCRAAFAMVRGMFLAYLSQKVDLAIMLEYYRHVLKLPMHFFDTRQVGEIISRFGDAIKIRQLISGGTLTVLVDSATMVGAFVILCIYNWRLALLSLMIYPFMALNVCLISRPLKRAQRITMEETASLQSCLVESLNGITAIKAYSAEDQVGDKTERKIIRLLRSSFRANAWNITSNIAGEVVTGIGIVAILWRAGWMVLQGQLTAGQMVAFYSILLYLLQPVLRLVSMNQNVQDAVVAADRLWEILDLKTEFNQASNTLDPSGVAPGEIVLKGVNFRYGTREKVLHDISLRIPPRSILALVGESGSGKTTLARLLIRYYDPTSGQIVMDGDDLRDLRLETLRAKIGYVDQEVSLFSGTIEDNLTLGRSQVTFDDIIRAVRAVGLEPFINGLPSRYQTYVGERGLSLSGGQRQRLAIARALVGNPQILILDECTSNLDFQAENIIQTLLRDLKAQKTIVIITHRLSTLMQANIIVVMDNGRIREQGSHQQLIQARGFYHDLWQARDPGRESTVRLSKPLLEEAKT